MPLIIFGLGGGHSCIHKHTSNVSTKVISVNHAYVAGFAKTQINPAKTEIQKLA